MSANFIDIEDYKTEQLNDILVLVELFSKIIAIVLFSKGVGEINPDLI